MKTTLTLIITLVAMGTVGCTDKAKEAEKVKADAAAKARAEAAKKEMKTLPEVFSTPDYFKKNEPSKPAATTAAKSEPPKK